MIPEPISSRSGRKLASGWLAISKILCGAASTLTLSTSLLLADEPPAPRIIFHQSNHARSMQQPSSRYPANPSQVTFPATSPAPLRWKTASPEVRQVAHIDDVEHSTTEVAPPAVPATGNVRPVAFTLQLDSPKNGQQSDEDNSVHPAAGEDRSEKTRSVLSARRPQGGASSNPFKDPFGDRGAASSGQTSEPASPSLLGNPRAGEATEIVADETETLVQPEGGDFRSDDVIPPMPEADPDDPAPTPPRSLRSRPMPESELSGDDPSPNPVKDLPGENGRPTGRRGLPGCNNPNDRDCCEDEEECLRSLDRVKTDTLRMFGKDRLDITPAYRPDADTPEEIEAAQERKKQQLTLSGKKDWKDKNGRVLAHGQLVDIALGKAIIETESGRNVELKLQGLYDDDLCFIAAWYNLPTECTLGNEQFQDRQYVASTFTWTASALCHKPLYFEEVQLERYGHTTGPVAQPFVSGAHFFVNIALLPYKMGINPPQECQYSLGYYRPGSCAPWMVPPFPLSVRGAAVATGFYTGGVAIIP